MANFRKSDQDCSKESGTLFSGLVLRRVTNHDDDEDADADDDDDDQCVLLFHRFTHIYNTYKYPAYI